MLTITSVIGNIFDNKKLMIRFKQMELKKSCEKIKIPRQELERGRMRKKTDLGTDIGLIIDAGLRHGDVIVSNLKKFIIVEQLPERVLSVKIKKSQKNPFELITLGHMIGNRHKPIVIENDILSFPIHADSEAETFKKLLLSVLDDLEFEIEEQIFQPLHGTYMHEH